MQCQYETSQADLVPLLQACRFFGPWMTAVLNHFENTVRVAERCDGAWANGNSQVTLDVRRGRRARRMARQGRPQPLDLDLLADLGFLPVELLTTMQVPGTTFWLARSVRHYGTFEGHLHVEGMAGLVEYVGYHHIYCMPANHHPLGCAVTYALWTLISFSPTLNFH